MIAHLLAAIAVFALAAQPSPTASDATVVVADATASVYLVINNPTMYDIYVISATSEAAGKVELYSADKPVKNMTVAAYGSLALKAGGMFLRLSDMKHPLKTGESISVTMVTDGGIAILATATVKQ